MKTMLVAFATMLTVAVSGFVATAQTVPAKLEIGAGLPGADMKLQNATGNSTRIKDAMGKNGLLVMFSCNTCPFVIKNEPITKKTLEYAAANSVGVVIVNSNEAKRGGDDSYAAMKEYAVSQGYEVPYVIDENSRLADMFGANHTPEVFLFNNQSKLVYRGAMNDNPGNPDGYKVMYIQDAINAIVAGREVKPATTKSIGCSIKRKA
jgi:hypothetical protein